MCLICDRIEMIKNGTNPYFVKELETGYVVMGDHQHFTGIRFSSTKSTEIKRSCFILKPLKKKFSGGNVSGGRSRFKSL